MAKLNIVVLNYNNYEDTKDCLISLVDISNDIISVIVVDNGSLDDSTYQLNKEFGEFRYVYKKDNNGYAGGMNFAISEALKDKNCEYIFCLTNDTILQECNLVKFIEMADREENKKFASFQPKMLWFYDKNILETTGLLYSKNGIGFSRGGFDKSTKYLKTEEIFGCYGGACIFRRNAVEDLIEKDGEFFDQDFFAYYEDMDIAFRLRWRGWESLYVPDISFSHKLSKTFRKEPSTKIYLSQRNSMYLIFKDLPTDFILKNILFIFIGQLAYMFSKIFIGHTVSFSGKLDGIKNYKKMLFKRKKIQKDKENWKNIEKFIVNKWRRNKPKYL